MSMRTEYQTCADTACSWRKVKSGSENLCGAATDAFHLLPDNCKAKFQKNLKWWRYPESAPVSAQDVNNVAF